MDRITNVEARQYTVGYGTTYDVTVYTKDGNVRRTVRLEHPINKTVEEVESIVADRVSNTVTQTIISKKQRKVVTIELKKLLKGKFTVPVN